VLLADANPAIGALPVATLTSLPEMNQMSGGHPGSAGGEVTGVGAEPVEAADSLLRPNLGPPPPRPDWRRRRQS
jgi:hypothetical protein